MVAISYDSPKVLERFQAKRNITFLLLSDSGSKTIDAYGIRNRQAAPRVDGIPHPMTFVLDAKGIVRAKLAHDGYRTRHEPAELVAELKKLR